MRKFLGFCSAPKTIEAFAVSCAALMILGAVLTLRAIPEPEFTRDSVLRVLEVAFSALGFSTLLMLWAQLRHSSTLNKRLAYHEYFHDLPTGNKVVALYELLQRLDIPIPRQSSALSDVHRDLIVSDAAPAPTTGDIVVREYLNDFEEFAAAVNCGLIDDDYAYHIEGPRTLNAYFGFRSIIDYWIRTDRDIAERSDTSESGIYEELRKLTAKWQSRRKLEAEEEQKKRKKGIKSAF